MVSWIAGTASFFVVGLGQALKGEFEKGLKFFLAFVLLGLVRLVAAIQIGLQEQVMLLVTLVTGLLMAVIYFVQLVDAFGVIDTSDYLPYL